MFVVIRPADSTDFDAVGTIFTQENRLHAELVPEIVQALEPIMDVAWFAELLSKPKGTLLLGEVDGVVVGLIWLSIRSNPDDPIYRPRNYVYVEELAVLEEHRGQGIGRRLMEAAKVWAMEQDVAHIELDVWEANRNAIAFYEHLDYQPMRRRMRYSLTNSSTAKDKA
jgi:ribosomal protein S18 acetylase RimI-like enzyme